MTEQTSKKTKLTMKTNKQLYQLMLAGNKDGLSDEELKAFDSLAAGYTIALGACYDIVNDVLNYRKKHTIKQTDATIKKVFVGVPLEWAKLYKKTPLELADFWKKLSWNKMCKYAAYLNVAAQIEAQLGQITTKNL